MSILDDNDNDYDYDDDDRDDDDDHYDDDDNDDDLPIWWELWQAEWDGHSGDEDAVEHGEHC